MKNLRKSEIKRNISDNKQTKYERISIDIPKVTIAHKEVHTRDKEPTDVTYVENK